MEGERPAFSFNLLSWVGPLLYHLFSYSVANGVKRR